jgi:hypothetical protein
VYRHDGKPRSFRLNLYVADSLIGLSGRGYLGKGALKGRLTADSLIVYFPASDEYLRESVAELIGESSCTFQMFGERMLEFFQVLPDQLSSNGDFSIISSWKDDKRPVFIVSADSCTWQLELEYDWQATGWRLRRFDFSDGNGKELRGKRRTYKNDRSVKPARFEVLIPEEAVRIHP